MRRFLSSMGLVALLAGCGVDGAPLPPDSRERTTSGISISGSAQMGVAGGSGMSTRPVSRIGGLEIGMAR